MSEKSRNLAEVMRQRTLEAEKRENERRLAENEKKQEERNDLNAEMKILASKEYTECIEKIKKEADSNKKKARYTLMTFGDEAMPDHIEFLAEHLSTLLRADGFTVKIVRDSDEPHGSDPLFDHTVYSTWLEISW